MLRRLLNIASIVCLVLCVVLMGMWVRSFWRADFVTLATPSQICRVASALGQIRCEGLNGVPLAPGAIAVGLRFGHKLGYSEPAAHRRSVVDTHRLGGISAAE